MPCLPSGGGSARESAFHRRIFFDTFARDGRPEKLPAFFYRTAAGAEPVRDWLKALTSADRKRIGEDIKTVEFGWPIGMPTCKPLGDGVFEVRTDLAQGRTARVLFSVHAGRMYLLHAFIKKSRKTPATELDLALRRMRKLEKQQ